MKEPLYDDSDKREQNVTMKELLYDDSNKKEQYCWKINETDETLNSDASCFYRNKPLSLTWHR